MEIIDSEHVVPLPKELYTDDFHQFRRCKIMLFMNSLAANEKFKVLDKSKKISIAREIERGCFNNAIDTANEQNIMTSWKDEMFCKIYHLKCSKLSFNIGKSSLIDNERLSNDILDKKIELSELSYKSSIDMYPEKYSEILDRIHTSKTVTTNIKFSSLYRCRICKQSKCKIENRYNRSLDEGTNSTITCLNCSHEWNA